MTGLPCGAGRELAPIGMERVGEMQVQPAGIARGNGLQRGPATLVALHRDDPLGALQQKRARQPARSGTDLDHRLASERCRLPARCGASG